jgi:hypothetical protein
MSQAAVQSHPLLFDDIPVADMGTISIRVFVLPAKQKKGEEKATTLPLDLQEGEEFLLDQKGGTPVSSYLESNRGKRCVVYLVNGQRQEADDNGFIVQDLGFRYLRARMIIMIDVDGLAPEAIGRLMQGSRQGFYKGAVREAILRRIVATLKHDPDLIRLEEEAEEAVSELSAGDEKVKQTLDQLIDAHHDKGHAFAQGAGSSAGDSQNTDDLGFKTITKNGVVTLLPPDTGQAADYPVLMSQPASSIIRLRPNQPREIGIKSIPSEHWGALAQFNVESDTNVPELTLKQEKLDNHAKVTLTFIEPDGFDTDQYPVRAKVKATARFNGIVEPRQVELSILIKPDVYRPDPLLVDDPTKLKVSSREPIRIRRSENDTHVRLRWDGKDRLLAGAVPKWSMSARLLNSSRPPPQMNFSDPVAGRFSLLISPRPEWKPTEQFMFEVRATGPGGRQLTASFRAEVIDPPPPPEDEPAKEPRLVDGGFKTGTMRRPPYLLKIIRRDDYNQPCWDSPEWTDEDAGAFIKPTDRAPLILIINEDMIALREFKQALTKRNTEQDVQRKVNKYTSHIAFHLYQMYQATVGRKDNDIDTADAARREEIRRVATTMIKLMDVAER